MHPWVNEGALRAPSGPEKRGARDYALLDQGCLSALTHQRAADSVMLPTRRMLDTEGSARALQGRRTPAYVLQQHTSPVDNSSLFARTS